MKITGQIEMMMIELQREGVLPRFILIGKNQYERWILEFDDGIIDNLLEKGEKYMNCEIIICKSDIIEVVAEGKFQQHIK